MSIGDVNVDKYTQLRQQIKLDCLQSSKEDGKHSQRKKVNRGHCSLLQLHIFLDTTRVVLHDSKIILIYPALGLVQPLSSTTVWNSPF